MKVQKAHPAMNETIKSFAVDLLGCGCSNDVFNTIEISDDTFGRSLPGGKRILIGERLLIYVVPWHGPALTAAEISYFVQRGRDERDANGYNRFRLVIAATQPEVLFELTAELFRSAAGGDDKLHFHVLPADNRLVRGILGK